MRYSKELVEHTIRGRWSIVENAQCHTGLHRNQSAKQFAKIEYKRSTYQTGEGVEFRDDRCLGVFVIGNKVRSRIRHCLKLIASINDQTTPDLPLRVGRECEFRDDALQKKQSDLY